MKKYGYLFWYAVVLCILQAFACVTAQGDGVANIDQDEDKHAETHGISGTNTNVSSDIDVLVQTTIPQQGQSENGNESEANPTPGQLISATAVPEEELSQFTDTNETEQPATKDDKVVYLTFDDGPSKLTPQLLDILDKYGVKATFFTVGYFVERYPEITIDIMKRGHLLACHTYSHDYEKIYASADAFRNDMSEWETAVLNAVGELPKTNCLRFPGGSHMPQLAENIKLQILDILEDEGYSYYDWTFSNNDKWPAGNTNELPFEEYLAESYYKTLEIAERNGYPLIFLAHDTCEESVEIMPTIIEDLITRGYTFRTLADYTE